MTALKAGSHTRLFHSHAPLCYLFLKRGKMSTVESHSTRVHKNLWLVEFDQGNRFGLLYTSDIARRIEEKDLLIVVFWTEARIFLDYLCLGIQELRKWYDRQQMSRAEYRDTYTGKPMIIRQCVCRADWKKHGSLHLDIITKKDSDLLRVIGGWNHMAVEHFGATLAMLERDYKSKIIRSYAFDLDEFEKIKLTIETSIANREARR